jgi:hypothetical protein
MFSGHPQHIALLVAAAYARPLRLVDNLIRYHAFGIEAEGFSKGAFCRCRRGLRTNIYQPLPAGHGSVSDGLC